MSKTPSEANKSNPVNPSSSNSSSLQDLLALELARDGKAVELLAEQVLSQARTTVFKELRVAAVGVAFVLSVLGISTWWSIDDKVKSQVTTAVSESLKDRQDEIQKGQNDLFMKLGGLQQNTVAIGAQAQTTHDLLDQAKKDTLALQAESKKALLEVKHELDVVRSESEQAQKYLITIRSGPETDRASDSAEVRLYFDTLPGNIFAIAGSSKIGLAADQSDGGVFTTAFVRAMSEAPDKNDDGMLSLSELGIACKRYMGVRQKPVFGGRDFPLLAVKGVAAKKSANRKLRALVIGLNALDPKAYDGYKSSLTGPEQDVDHIKKVLEDKERLLVSDASVTTLEAKEATRDHILQQISLIAEQASKNDVVVCFFSGHGTEAPDKTALSMGLRTLNNTSRKFARTMA